LIPLLLESGSLEDRGALRRARRIGRRRRRDGEGGGGDNDQNGADRHGGAIIIVMPRARLTFTPRAGSETRMRISGGLRVRRSAAVLAVFTVVAGVLACGGRDEAATTDTAAAPPRRPPSRRDRRRAAPRRDALTGGPYPALFVAQAQFVDKVGPDGKPTSVPGPAKLTIVRQTPTGWTASVLEDPDSNVFHKAVQTPEGLMTIGANKAFLKTWTFATARGSS
jgi:hypothetical protein